MSHPFKVAQLNTRASTTPWALAELAVEENQVDVFLIQDPPAVAKLHRWRNFALVLPRVRNPLVAILIRRGIKFRLEGWGSARVMWLTLFFRRPSHCSGKLIHPLAIGMAYVGGHNR